MAGMPWKSALRKITPKYVEPPHRNIDGDLLPGVRETRVPVEMGCLNENNVRGTDMIGRPCLVCGHDHTNLLPFCAICRLEKRIADLEAKI